MPARAEDSKNFLDKPSQDQNISLIWGNYDAFAASTYSTDIEKLCRPTYSCRQKRVLSQMEAGQFVEGIALMGLGQTLGVATEMSK